MIAVVVVVVDGLECSSQGTCSSLEAVLTRYRPRFDQSREK